MTSFHRIQPDHKVATLGSCFAQHVSRHLRSKGGNYYVAEVPPAGMSEAQALAESYGVFSARYGNVYTARQALQLFDRAFGEFSPADDVWEYENGFVDAFRPLINSEPSRTITEVRDSARIHLESVRKVFLSSDWIIFTLGLTEAWRSRVDGAVYPMAPGVHGGAYNADKYAFVNFTANEVADDLRSLIVKVSKVNSKIRFILTVSPVPLIATFVPRHVLVSTVFSKAALRVSADVIERELENVVYFPAYEIITTPIVHQSYFNDDLREVSEPGVRHVMRVFSRHFLEAEKIEAASHETGAVRPPPEATDMVCDEEEIERAIAKSGSKRG